MENKEQEAYWSWIDFLGDDVDDHIWGTLYYAETNGLLNIHQPWRWWCEDYYFVLGMDRK